tara:strand:- start:476 stop:2218 length:1743 start_codon:yes stop_codon:yes gene_type:complete
MNSDTKTLGDIIFRNAKYRVKIPKYQRPYAWELQQIEEFWDDIVQTNPTFFLGPVIVNIEHIKSKDPYIEVVDGQQRLITATILSAVIRDVYISFGKEDLASIIQGNFISYKDLDNIDRGFRLTTGLSTNEFFSHFIQTSPSTIDESSPVTKEEKRIKNNYITLRKLLLEHISAETSNENKIKKISDVRDRLNKLTVIEIEIENDSEAYEIFERVNNYGIDLSLSDLLKNHILKNSTNPDEAHKTWYEIEKNIQSSESEMKKFIRYHWLSKYRFKTEKQIYNDIKANIRDYDVFLIELFESSELYLDILKGNRPDFMDLKVNGKNISSKIYTLILASRYMGISQDNVFYLSLLRNIHQNKLIVNPANFFLFLENFLFKYFAVSTLPANKVEKLFSKYAIELEAFCNSSKEEKNLKKETNRMFDHFKNDLKDLIPVKEYFNEKFDEIKYSNTEKARRIITYILSKYENYLNDIIEKNIDYDNVNIEHVLPQKPESWGLSRSEIKGYVHKIGNLTLISKKLNSQMGNIELEKKIPILKKSGLKINKVLINFINKKNNKWTEDLITERSNMLSSLAYDEIWKS